MKKFKFLIIAFIATITLSLSSCEDLAACGSATAVFYNSMGYSITLIVDGGVVGSISNGSSKSMTLSEGKHTYSIGGSQETKSFSLNDCGTLNIEISKR
ncbi:hypothetical protein [Roseivirga pacifica]|uniref:hypothetical protein n=1 Tax=Roseivirga pacifica TaxID=1267423 RepID=UPI002095ADB2|nr:hypothetical protein [Roseivirga pacifica]MCO6357302.1 hypothetical protein [Roseivirga pacifica]MCO6367984.1 hypothetical protein [Roseivirga pacifica]MCO6369534.1 hypothetical protein [Roseivirga pacifica]MCO6373388.1 hypothetical protein [Roseivirga pacifica]MCO6377355.1 hypothetical protein [Roseivirga pacifica]